MLTEQEYSALDFARLAWRRRVKLFALPMFAVVPYVASEADRRRQLIGRFLAAGATTITLVMGGYLFWVMELWRHIA